MNGGEWSSVGQARVSCSAGVHSQGHRPVSRAEERPRLAASVPFGRLLFVQTGIKADWLILGPDPALSQTVSAISRDLALGRQLWPPASWHETFILACLHRNFSIQPRSTTARRQAWGRTTFISTPIFKSDLPTAIRSEMISR